MPLKRHIRCPLCHTEWTETTRERGSCPGCGAGLSEMLYAYTAYQATIEEKIDAILAELKRPL